VLILNTHEYYKKINDFISENQFIKVEKDPTNYYYKQEKQIINKSNIIWNNEKWKLRNLKPTPPPKKLKVSLSYKKHIPPLVLLLVLSIRLLTI
jgi:hypothetical protein